jgi:hypothetical protein
MQSDSIDAIHEWKHSFNVGFARISFFQSVLVENSACFQQKVAWMLLEFPILVKAC